MKRLFLFLGILLLALSSTFAQKKKLPPLNQLAMINDSIIAEGHQIYFSEKIAWITTDSLFAHKHTEDEIGASLTYFEDSVWISLFTDIDVKNSIFEIRWDFKQETDTLIDAVRPLTDNEKAFIVRKNKLIQTGIGTYRDSINGINPKYGQFNVDIIRINDKVTRLYLLQGINFEAIPFGNDYSIDFDNNDNPICFRRYHRSFNPMEFPKDDNKKVLTIIHSHLPDNPYITPTDICNFLLYGRDLFGQTSFIVLSTAFEGHIKFMYMDSQKSIATVTDELFE